MTQLNSDLTSGLAGKAAASHAHDERYYTEAEIDSLLNTISTRCGVVGAINTYGDTGHLGAFV